MTRDAASEPHVFDFREIADYVIENDDTATAANALRNAQAEIDRLYGIEAAAGAFADLWRGSSLGVDSFGRALAKLRGALSSGR